MEIKRLTNGNKRNIIMETISGEASMTVTEMRAKKKEMGYTNEQIAELSGVPLGTVQKIFAGLTESPRYDTLKALEAVFQENVNMVSESVKAYRVKKQGEYTLEDYYALPDERRVELIDGVVYDMSSPTSVHQILAAEIWQQIKSYINKKRGT